MLKYYYQQHNMLYHVVYVRMDAEGEVQNRNTKNTRVTWFSLDGLHPRRNPLRPTSLLYKSVYITCIIMSHNMSIYRRLNPRLLVQVELDLGLLHQTNICLIYISNTNHPIPTINHHTHSWRRVHRLMKWCSILITLSSGGATHTGGGAKAPPKF